MDDDDVQPVSGALIAPAELAAAADDVEDLVPMSVAMEIEEAEIVFDDDDEFPLAFDQEKLESALPVPGLARLQFAPTDSDESGIEPYPQSGEEEMPAANQSVVPYKGSGSPAPVLFTVRGKSAKIDGAFGDAESVEVHGDVNGDLRVGGLLVIGEEATVNGNATAQSIRVEGEFTGDLRAVEAIEIAASGTVNGTLKCDELVIERGGIFNGTATRTARPKQPASAGRDRVAGRERQASRRTAVASRSVVGRRRHPARDERAGLRLGRRQFDSYDKGKDSLA